MYRVRARAQAPDRLLVRVTNADLASEPLDFSTVTAVAIEVVTPAGARPVWSATITGQDADALTLEHVWAIDDIWVPGVYPFAVLLVVPSGVRRSGLSALSVVP